MKVGLDQHDGTRRRAILTREVSHNLRTANPADWLNRVTGQTPGGASVGKASFIYNVSPTAVVGGATTGPSWGKSNVNIVLTFGGNVPKTGSKNALTAPRPPLGHPHKGPCVEPEPQNLEPTPF